MIYNVDIVMCIDITGSMQSCIDTVKERAIKFWPDLKAALEAASKDVKDVRVKVIGYRDFEADGNNALEESRFFNLSDQGSSDPEEYQNFINSLSANGGGDEPEDSLEALSLAMKTDWSVSGEKSRHIIVLFTDASAHKLENANRSNPNYPENMPESFDELTDWWTSVGQQGGKTKLKQSAKRLIIFAPQMYPWPELFESWEQVIYNPSEAGKGLDEVTYDDILNTIVGSI